MKKLLFVLGALSLTTVASTTVVACNKDSGSDISKLTTLPQPATFTEGQTYGQLVDPAIQPATSVLTYISGVIATLNVKDVAITTDYTVDIADKGTTQVEGTTKEVTVAATKDGKLKGSFKFNVEVVANGKVAIASLTATDITRAAKPTQTYADLLKSSEIVDKVADVFKASTDAIIKSAVATVDYTITCDKTTGNETAGDVATFTVTGQGRLNGQFTFTLTLS